MGSFLDLYKHRITTRVRIKLTPILDWLLGFLDVLSYLTSVGPQSRATFLDRFNYMKQHNDTYFVIVIEDTKKGVIVGAGTLVIERKFIHNNGMVSLK